ncbi:MAG: chemotaxis methyl-accepting protein methylase [Bacteroidia bacterium]
MYFRGWRQKQVLNNLVQRLKLGVILLIGASEGRGWQHSELIKLPGDDVQVFERHRDGNQ